MQTPLSPEKAQQVFEAMAAQGDKIAFRHLQEGCECRAQLMIESMEQLGINPGRAWAVAVGCLLVCANPVNPKAPLKWFNHTAPTVAVEGSPHGVLVIDPSLSRTGPMTLYEWAGAMRARAIAVFEEPRSQAQILELQRDRALAREQAATLRARLARHAATPDGGAAIEAALAGFDARNEDGRQALHRLLERQHYRLAWWRAAADEINWRRFFDITSLAGMRVELPEVFDATHELILKLYAEGAVDGWHKVGRMWAAAMPV